MGGGRWLWKEERGDETPSSHDKRHLGTIGSLGRWKKKEINAACCRGHGDLRMETGLRRASGGVMGSWRRAMGCIGAVGKRGGRTSKRNGLLASWQGLFSPTHPYPKPVCGRQYLAGLALLV